jgi:glycosyltransferase involved in cell wall biosynthesis
MFGWEFPPFISGGLGTACYGITQGLVNNGVEVTFVLPSRRGQTMDNMPIRIVAADEIARSQSFTRQYEETSEKTIEETRSAVTRLADTPFSPYYTGAVEPQTITQTQTVKHTRQERRTGQRQEVRGLTQAGLLDFTGNYGRNLMREVAQYSVIGDYLGATEEFDVIHAHDWLTVSAGVAAKKASGKPLVVQVHATEFDRSGEHVNQAVYDLERYGMEQADKVIAVSHYTKNIIQRRYGIAADKIEVVHNAVDKERFVKSIGIQRPLKEKIVLFLGRVTMQKGPDYFIEAANLVLQRMKNVRFVMAGSGDMLPRMITRMASLKIADKFHFTGFLHGASVEKMYALCDLYVMPSVSEPFGISAFEALLYDVPVILSKHSGVAEVLKGAYLVDFWDVSKLAASIVQLLQNDTLAREVVARCQGDMQHIGWSHAGYRISNVYRALAG